MVDVNLLIHKKWLEDYENKEELKLAHTQRAKLIHGLVDTLDLEVKDWGETNDSEPHEVVEIIVALGSAGVFTAMVSVMKIWIEKNKIKDFTMKIESQGKPTIFLNAKEINESQVQSIITTVKDALR